MSKSGIEAGPREMAVGQEDAPSGRTKRSSLDRLSIQSVDKAFRVLDAFSIEQPTLGLTQIARVSGLDKSAAQRFVHSLESLGYLHKDPTTKQFGLTVKTLDLGFRYLRSNPLIERALPYLLHLSEATEETVNLTLLDDISVVFVTRLMSRHMLQTDVMIGTRMPAYCTAPGRAMLSRLSPQDARQVLERSDLRAHTPNTIWQMDDLIKELEISRSRGYATAFEEVYHGDLSIAAAVVDRAGRAIGAVSVGVSRARFTPEDAEARFASLTVATALSIS